MANIKESIGVELLPQEINVTLVDPHGLVKKVWNRTLEIGNPIDSLPLILAELLGKKWKQYPAFMSMALNSLSQTSVVFNRNLQNEKVGIDWFLSKYLGEKDHKFVVEYDIDELNGSSRTAQIAAMNPREMDEIIEKFAALNYKPKTLLPEPVALMNALEKQGALNGKGVAFKINQQSSFWLFYNEGRIVKMGAIQTTDAEYPLSLTQGMQNVINLLGLNAKEDGVFLCGSKLKEPSLLSTVQTELGSAVQIDLITGNSTVDVNVEVIHCGSIAYSLVAQNGAL